MKIHLLKEKKLFRKRRTYCNQEAEYYKVMELIKTDLTEKPEFCTCNNCLIKQEQKHLSEIFI